MGKSGGSHTGSAPKRGLKGNRLGRAAVPVPKAAPTARGVSRVGGNRKPTTGKSFASVPSARAGAAGRKLSVAANWAAFLRHTMIPPDTARESQGGACRLCPQPSWRFRVIWHGALFVGGPSPPHPSPWHHTAREAEPDCSLLPPEPLTARSPSRWLEPGYGS